MKRLIILVIVLLIILGAWNALLQYSPQLRDFFANNQVIPTPETSVTVLPEENIIIDVVKEVGPSVVTIAITSDQRSLFENDPFGFFGELEEKEDGPQDIGSGFVVSADGLIVTNKHVVSDTGVTYSVITNDNRTLEVERIYRDPNNDIALVKVKTQGKNLKPVIMGDSEKVQVGQLAIAIGTALGEFRNTVTTGVISGVGRGITAGSYFRGFTEQLDNVIQTDAAINPGNSGGPLLNSSGQVIGVNTAVSSTAQNIGFALPINTVKEAIENFNNTGGFNRPYLGVAYRMITEEIAERNKIPVGAYVQEVVENSPAAKAGIQSGDIITEFDGQKVTGESNLLANLIAKKKVGESVTLKVWREAGNGSGSTQDITATLETAPGE